MNKKAWRGILIMLIIAGFLLPNPLLFAESNTKVNSAKEIESVFVATKARLNGEEMFLLTGRQEVKNGLAQLQAGTDGDAALTLLLLVGSILCFRSWREEKRGKVNKNICKIIVT